MTFTPFEPKSGFSLLSDALKGIGENLGFSGKAPVDELVLPDIDTPIEKPSTKLPANFFTTPQVEFPSTELRAGLPAKGQVFPDKKTAKAAQEAFIRSGDLSALPKYAEVKTLTPVEKQKGEAQFKEFQKPINRVKREIGDTMFALGASMENAALGVELTALSLARAMSEQTVSGVGQPSTPLAEEPYYQKILSDIQDIKNQKVKLSSGIKGDFQSVLFDVANTASSLALAVGTLYLTKSPVGSVALLSAMDGVPSYNEARDAGKTPAEALLIAGATTAGIAALENWGLKMFMANAINPVAKTINKAFVGFVQEGAQETLQTLWQNSVARIGFDKTQEITEGIVESFLLGGLVGGVGGVVVGVVDAKVRGKAIKEIQDLGFNKEEATTFVDGMIDVAESKANEITTTMGSFKEARLVGLKGLEGGDVTPGVDVPAPLPRRTFGLVDENAPMSLQKVESEVLAELQESEAEQRLFIEGEVTGIKSTFPEWVPEDLRKSNILKGAIQSILEGKLPRGAKQKELVEIIEVEVNDRARQEGLDIAVARPTGGGKRNKASDERRKQIQIRTEAIKAERRKSELKLLKQKVEEGANVLALEMSLGKKEAQAKTRGEEKVKETKIRLEGRIEKEKSKKRIANRLRTDLTNYAKRFLGKDAGRMSLRIARADTRIKFDNVVKEIIELSENLNRKSLIKQIKTELSKPTVGRDGKGKYSPFVNRMLKSFKDNISELTFEGLKHKKILKVQKFKSENPDVELPESLIDELDKLDRQHLELLTTSELQEQLESIQTLKRQGKTFKKMKLERKARKRKEVVDDFNDIILQGKELDNIPPRSKHETILESILFKARQLAGLEKVPFKFILNQYNSDNLFDILDEVSNVAPYAGKIFNKFQSLANNARDLEIDGVFTTLTNFQNKLLELGLGKNFGDIVVIRGDRWSRAELLGAYIKSHDSAILESMIKGNGLSEDNIQEMIAELTESEKELGDFILKYYKDNFEPVNEVFREDNFMDMEDNEGYSPMDKELSKSEVASRKKAGKSEDINLLEMYTDYRQASVRKSFTKKRTGSTIKVKLDALSTLVDHIIRTEHYKAFQLPIQEMNAILNGMEKAVTQEYGEDYFDVLKKWVGSIANDGRFSTTDLDRIVLKIRTGLTKGVLGLNLVTALKQSISLGGFLTEINEAELAKGVTAYWANKKEWDAHWDSVPQIRNRSETLTRDISDISKTRSNIEKLSNQQRWSEKTMAMIRAVDKLTVRSGATAVYLAKGGELGKVNVEALDSTLGAVRRTQPTGDVKDLSMFQKGGVLEKALTMFMNQPNKYANILYSNMRAFRRGRITKGQFARALIYSWILPAFLFEFITSAGTADDEDYAKAIALGPFKNMLFVGTIVDAARTGFDYSASPVEDLPERVSGELAKILNGDFYEAVLRLAEVAALVKGVPINQPKRTLSGIRDLYTGQTKDWRRLIWSEYTLGTDENFGFDLGDLDLDLGDLGDLDFGDLDL